MALEVGGVFARLGAKVDESGFDRYDRRLNAAEAKAKHGVTTHVNADTDKAERGLKDYERQVDRADESHTRLARGSGRLKTAMGSLFIGGAGVAAGAIAFGALAKGAMGAVDAWKESEVIGKRTVNVLTSTHHAAGIAATAVGDLATALSDKSGVDDEVIQSGENVLLTFTNVRNEVGKGNDIFTQATGLALDMSRALGTDLQGANIQLGKALNDPVKGITALSRVGVSFTKGQKDQIKTLVAHGQTVKAQKVILAELSKEFGGAAKASATWGDKLKVTLGNLQESVGKAIAPAFDKAAKGLNTFVSGMTTGTGAGGKFVTVAKGIGGAIKDVVGAIANGVKGFVSFVRGNKDAQQEGGRLKSVVLDLWKGLKQAGAGIAAAFKGVKPELETIGKAFLKIANVISAAITPVYRRVIPALVTVVKGLAQMLRGVIQVIAGLLSGNWGKAWEGAKRIVSGFVSGLGGILKGVVGIVGDLIGKVAGKAAAIAVGLVKALVKGAAKAPGALWDALKGVYVKLATLELGLAQRAASAAIALVKALVKGAAKAPGAVFDVVKSLPGKIASLAGDAARAAASIGRGIVSGVVNAIKAAPGAVGDAIKGLLPGPLKKLAGKIGLRYGGRVGPQSGGARAFIAGEGSMDEWVISQEGPRALNVGYAVEALETLTGRGVELHRGGTNRAGHKAKHKPARRPLKRILSSGQVSSAVTSQERGLGNYDRDLGRLDREYGQLDRANSLTTEDFVIEHDDGSTSLNFKAIDERTAEIDGQVAFIRDKIVAKIKDYRVKITAALKTYNTVIARLTGAIGRARGSRRQAERQGYVTKRDAYRGRVAELADKFQELGGDHGEAGDLYDKTLDMQELLNERADVTGTKPTAAPATTDDGGASSAPDGSALADPTAATPDAAAPAAPSALDIATAAAAAVAAYDSGRADLLSGMGRGNFMVGGGALGDAGTAAGARYFGAAGSGGDSGVLGQAGVTQHITLTINDAGDAHTFTQAALHEMRSAL